MKIIAPVVTLACIATLFFPPSAIVEPFYWSNVLLYISTIMWAVITVGALRT